MTANSTSKTAVAIAFAIIASGQLGCAPPTPGLPAIKSVTICSADAPPPPTLCQWVAAADAVVWGKVTDMRFSSDDVRFPSGDTAENCDAIDINPSFQMTITIKELIAGTDFGRAITLDYSPEVLNYWEPRPTLSADGSVEFIGVGAETDRIAIGQQLGAVVYEVGDKFTSSAEPFFIEEPDAVRFSRARDLCGLDPPLETQDAPPADLQQFTDAAASCEADAPATERAETMQFPAFDCCHPICIDEGP